MCRKTTPNLMVTRSALVRLLSNYILYSNISANYLYDHPILVSRLCVVLGDADPIDLSCFSGIIRQDANEKSRNCWAVPDSKIFKVRSKNFSRDKSKV